MTVVASAWQRLEGLTRRKRPGLTAEPFLYPAPWAYQRRS